MQRAAINLALGAAFLAVWGCQSAVAPLEVGLVSKAQAASTAAAPAAAKGEWAQVDARVKVFEAPSAAPRFRVLALPTTWTEARVTLHSPSVSAAYASGTHGRDIPFSAFSGTSPMTANASFGALRPATDYQGRVFLKNLAGLIETKRLAGSDTDTFTIQAGPNTLDFTITINGDEATYEIAPTSSVNLNNIQTAHVTTLAGNGTSGSADGIGTLATFTNPDDVAYIGGGEFFVIDKPNRIRRVSTTGNVSTHVATGTGLWNGLSVAPDGTIYAADSASHVIQMIATDGTVSTIAGLADNPGLVNANGSSARFNAPRDTQLDGLGNLFVSDFNNNAIRKIDLTDPTFPVTQIAGDAAGASGTALGAGSLARFNRPDGLDIDANGVLHIADSSNHRILKLDTKDVNYTVSLLAGGTYGYQDGTGSGARFRSPFALCVGRDGNTYVSDFINYRIRKITPAGVVTTIAGSSQGYTDGISTLARFNRVGGLALDGSGMLYAAENSNRRIRRVTLGNHLVKGDTVTLKTGVALSQPGVDRVDMYLSGACYTGGRTLIKRFTSAMAGSWNEFVWNTTTANTADSANYDPSLLVPTLTGLGYQTGRIDVESYNTSGEMVGQGSFTIHVYGQPSVTIRLQ